MTSLQSNGVSQAAGGLAQDAGAGIEPPHTGQPGAQRRRRRFPAPCSGNADQPNTSLPADLVDGKSSPGGPPRNRIGAIPRVSRSGFTRPAIETRGECLDKRSNGQRRPRESASPRPGTASRPHPVGRSAGNRGPGPRERSGRDVPQRRPEPRLYALEVGG